MITGFFTVNGRTYEYPIFAGITCLDSIRKFANGMGWNEWKFNCQTSDGWVILNQNS